MKITPQSGQQGIQNLTLKEGTVSTSQSAAQIVPPKIATISTQYLSKNVAGTITPTLTQGTSPVTWSAGSGMPPGMSVNSSTGVISGTPTTSGVYTVNLMASNTGLGSGGGSDTETFTINVADALTLTAPANQTFLQGGTLSMTLPAATAGTTPYTYTLTGLPSGASFNASTRVLSAAGFEYAWHLHADILGHR